jgi:hypothetical protein
MQLPHTARTAALTNKMSNEFTKSGPNTAASSEGFSVTAITSGGISYQDANGRVSIDSEWFLEPTFYIAVYRNSPDNAGLAGKTPAQVAEIFERVFRALRFLGHQAESR